MGVVGLVAIAVGLGVLAGVVAAETTAIGFEEFDHGTELTTQYEEAGVAFVPQGQSSAGVLVERCGPNSGNCTVANTGENAVVTPQDGDFVRHPLVASFDVPQDRVRVFVQETVDIPEPHVAGLVARDESGEVVARSAVEFMPGSGWHAISVSAPSAGIAGVTLTLGTVEDRDTPHNNLVADDLAFQRNEAPTAAFESAPNEPRVGEEVTFDATGSADPDGEIVRYSWDFTGDGRPDRNTTIPEASHTFREPGTKTVSLLVVDDDGALGRAESSIRIAEPPGPGSDIPTILTLGGVGLVGAWLLYRGAGRWRRDGDDDGSNQPPVPRISYTPDEPTVGRPVRFDGSPSHDPDPDDRITDYRWTVAARTGTGPRLVHEFEEAGEHEVSLAVTDSRGSTRTGTETVTVAEGQGELALKTLHPDAPGDDHENLDQEYFVFENAGEGTLDLGGWSIHDTAEQEDRVEAGEHSFTFPDGLELESGETVAVHVGEEPDGGASSVEPDEDHHLFWGRDWAVWNNDEDVVVVEDDAGNPVFAVRYEQTDDGEFEQEKLDPSALADWFSVEDDE